MLTAVLWKWADPLSRTRYSAAHVNVLARSIRRHYSGPIRIVCFTDDPDGITECETLPIWAEHHKAESVMDRGVPLCLRRLRIFSDEMESLLGPRIVSIDLDALILGELNSLWDRPEDFVGWRVTNGMEPRVYNGSMFLLRAGAHSEVWDRFDPAISVPAMRRAGYCRGSDQSWMAYVLPKDLPHWSAADGVESFRMDGYHSGKRPGSGTRIVFFHGVVKPWDLLRAPGFGWIAENWH